MNRHGLVWSKEAKTGDSATPEPVLPPKASKHQQGANSSGSRAAKILKVNSVSSARTQDSSSNASSKNRPPCPFVLASKPSPSKHKRRASLKDLCPEDKQRVKQLIEDLARAGAEKEKADVKFSREKKKFQKTLHLLHHEQKKILKEKENLQHSLHQMQQQLEVLSTASYHPQHGGLGGLQHSGPTAYKVGVHLPGSQHQSGSHTCVSGHSKPFLPSSNQQSELYTHTPGPHPSGPSTHMPPQPPSSQSVDVPSKSGLHICDSLHQGGPNPSGLHPSGVTDQYGPCPPVVIGQSRPLPFGAEHQNKELPSAAMQQSEPHPPGMMQQSEPLPHGVMQQSEPHPHGMMQQSEPLPHGVMQQSEPHPSGVMQQSEPLPHGVMQQSELLPHGVMQPSSLHPPSTMHQPPPRPQDVHNASGSHTHHALYKPTPDLSMSSMKQSSSQAPVSAHHTASNSRNQNIKRLQSRVDVGSRNDSSCGSMSLFSVPKYELYSEKSGSSSEMERIQNVNTHSLHSVSNRNVSSLPQETVSVCDVGTSVTPDGVQDSRVDRLESSRMQVTHTATQTLSCVATGTQTELEPATDSESTTPSLSTHSSSKPTHGSRPHESETLLSPSSQTLQPNPVIQEPLGNRSLLSSAGHTTYQHVADGRDSAGVLDNAQEMEEYGRIMGSLMSSALLRAEEAPCSFRDGTVGVEQSGCPTSEANERCVQCTEDMEKEWDDDIIEALNDTTLHTVKSWVVPDIVSTPHVETETFREMTAIHRKKGSEEKTLIEDLFFLS